MGKILIIAVSNRHIIFQILAMTLTRALLHQNILSCQTPTVSLNIDVYRNSSQFCLVVLMCEFREFVCPNDTHMPCCLRPWLGSYKNDKIKCVSWQKPDLSCTDTNLTVYITCRKLADFQCHVRSLPGAFHSMFRSAHHGQEPRYYTNTQRERSSKLVEMEFGFHPFLTLTAELLDVIYPATCIVYDTWG